METSLGSRQGCKFGAMIFNLMYCRASDDLRCALRNEGLLSEFAYYPEAAPWCHMSCKSDGTQLEESSYDMCAITYVDDECVCFEAESNAELLNQLETAQNGVCLADGWKATERSSEQRASVGIGAAKRVYRTLGGIECNIAPCYKLVGSPSFSTTCKEIHECQALQLQNESAVFFALCCCQFSFTGSRHGLSQLSRKGGGSKHSK